MTGLSGNEMWCLSKKGLYAGDLIIGNSVFSMGVIGSIGSGLKTLMGGEVTQVTQVVHEGRLNAYNRLVAEAQRRGGVGVTGVSNELLMLGSNIEFLSVGSTLHAQGHGGEQVAFTSAADGQELYCQIDAGFRPIRFVFGNVAYSIGVGGGILGGLRSLKRGEVKEYSDIFNHTRHLALQRITDEARQAGANAVVGVKTSILPFQGVQEMVMLGTASHHPTLPAQYSQTPISSDLTCQEMWNLVKMGYMPVQLVLGVSVYSLGLVGRMKNWFAALARGELTDYSKLVYEARANAIARIAADAQAVGADDVAGIKTYVYDLGGGLIEFLAIGTAVKKVPGVTTSSDQLPYQAIITDRDTFINAAEREQSANLNTGAKGKSGGREATSGAWGILKVILELIR
jgi:uncharacterized protein YbjQ (UPF0145 family)